MYTSLVSSTFLRDRRRDVLRGVERVVRDDDVLVRDQAENVAADTGHGVVGVAQVIQEDDAAVRVQRHAAVQRPLRPMLPLNRMTPLAFAL